MDHSPQDDPMQDIKIRQLEAQIEEMKSYCRRMEAASAEEKKRLERVEVDAAIRISQLEDQLSEVTREANFDLDGVIADVLTHSGPDPEAAIEAAIKSKAKERRRRIMRFVRETTSRSRDESPHGRRTQRDIEDLCDTLTGESLGESPPAGVAPHSEDCLCDHCTQ